MLLALPLAMPRCYLQCQCLAAASNGIYLPALPCRALVKARALRELAAQQAKLGEGSEPGKAGHTAVPVEAADWKRRD